MLTPTLRGFIDMTANRHKYFRWTPRTAWITFVYAAVVPGIIGVIAYKTDVGFASSRAGSMASLGRERNGDGAN